MSILIKGATMPKNCCECLGAYCDNNRWLCTLAGECVDRFIYVECGRPTFCPLVEIPPHGRLIDADKLIKNCEIWKETEIQDEHDDVWNRGIDACINEIKHHAPTVIESEEEE